jgi:hypothetical protein
MAEKLSEAVTASDLRVIADQVPLGYECRSCGRSAFNWISRINRLLTTGEPCCADMRSWCEVAAALAARSSPSPTSTE